MTKSRKNISRYKFWYNLNRRKILNLIGILALSIVGYSLLTAGNAATSTATIQAESGIKTTYAKVYSNNSASNGSAILFGTNNSAETNKTRLGVDINSLPPGISLSKAYDTIKSLGFGWVRTGPGISDYSNMNPNNFDYELAQANRTGTKVLIVMSYAYGNTGVSGCDNGHCKPKDPAAWANYAGRLVAHWKSLYPGVVLAVEVWNEANNPQFWDPVDPIAYTDLLKRTYLEIKSVDPSVTIMVSGPAPGGGNQDADSGSTSPSSGPMNPATFIKQIYTYGGKGFFDAGANHPYDTSNLTANSPGNGLRNTFWIRKVMDANADNTKKIWSTEAGVVSCLKGPGDNAPMTEAQRANRLVADLQDLWYGTHDSSDGHTINTTALSSDWNAGPYFVFKLYKSPGDGGLGVVYNTNAFMNNPPSSELANPGGDPEPLCKSSPDYFEPSIADVIRFLSAAPQ